MLAKDQADNPGATPLFTCSSKWPPRHRPVSSRCWCSQRSSSITLVETPLFTAAQNGHIDVVRFLVDVGAAKDQTDNNSRTPLWVAARNGHLDIVRFLVEVGLAKDQADNPGATPLFTAAQNGHLDIVRFLVDVGAAKDQAANAGETPLFTAAQNGQARRRPDSSRCWCSQRSNRIQW